MKRTTGRDTNSREFKKLLKRNGWTIDRTCKSSHIIYCKGDQKVMIKNSKINNMIQQRLIKELGLR